MKENQDCSLTNYSGTTSEVDLEDCLERMMDRSCLVSLGTLTLGFSELHYGL